MTTAAKPAKIDANTYEYRGRKITRRTGHTAVQFSGRIACGFAANTGWCAELGRYCTTEEIKAGMRSNRRTENFRTIALADAAIDHDLD